MADEVRMQQLVCLWHTAELDELDSAQAWETDVYKQTVS